MKPKPNPKRPSKSRSGAVKPFYDAFVRKPDAPTPASKPTPDAGAEDGSAPKRKPRKTVVEAGDAQKIDKPGTAVSKRFGRKPRKEGALDSPKPQAEPVITSKRFGRKPRKEAPSEIPAPIPRQKFERVTLPVRLNRYIAQSGICARRKADEMIVDGLVRVNGEVVKEMGLKIVPGQDKVEVNGKFITPQNFVYVLLNKPKNHLTTADDPDGRPTVMDIVRPATPERVFPVGRLDRNTTGVLLLTNDGELALKLSHPSSKIRKLYHVKLDKPVQAEHLQQLLNGIELNDGLATVDKIDYVEGSSKYEVGVELHSGRNRIVRRMFEHFGYSVEALDRVAFGPLTKKGIRRGFFRLLSEKEVGFLRMI